MAASVRSKGQVFVYGFLSSSDVTVGIRDLFRGVSVKGWSVYSVWDVREDLAKKATTLLAAKVIEPLPGEKFDLADFKEAIKKSEISGRGGRMLLTSGPR